MKRSPKRDRSRNANERGRPRRRRAARWCWLRGSASTGSVGLGGGRGWCLGSGAWTMVSRRQVGKQAAAHETHRPRRNRCSPCGRRSPRRARVRRRGWGRGGLRTARRDWILAQPILIRIRTTLTPMRITPSRQRRSPTPARAVPRSSPSASRPGRARGGSSPQQEDEGERRRWWMWRRY
ncbi:hypothetical protein B0H16DRAFT_1516040 [Mycena metata]|uniref:Uncharacterized protein n=1 Tax=Mycena metata TaxID=1033252 RepID=A0AAD7JRY0_9AGAR|nr:hypothetical protein B0H16DRAFT_1516040 [Mycena metata]